MDRSEIARRLMYGCAQGLLHGCPAEALPDHEIIAAAIMDGKSMEQILEMAEVDRWPETYVYLKSMAQDLMRTDVQ